ncbi:MAG: TonB-dependent receptor [Saprospiraceae bacterium]|nr:TonB-dependent receptor [Saprospiraceae bacterium]
MNKALIIIAMILSHTLSFAQNNITGNITDQDNEPLIGARIFVPELNKTTMSDENGNYELLDLPNGKTKIQFSYIGYTNQIETVEINEASIKLNVTLSMTPIETEEIVITGGFNSTQHDNAVKIEIFKLNLQTNKSTPNFAEILTRIPGIDMISKGSGVSKPVIRGLSMNDILILNNSVRYENYQYSSHHPLGIDEFGIEDVEVIKGPASLLYGSDAIGGVINFIKEKPAPIGSILGDYNFQLFSNTHGLSTNLGIKGASEKFFGGIRSGLKTNSDFLQGNGEYAPNSRFNEQSFKANAGFTDKTGTFKLFYDYNNQKLGLVEDEAIEEIKERGRKNDIFYQQLNTHLLSSQNKLYLNKFKVDLNAAYQNTELTHFSEPETYEIQMKLATLTYEAKLHLPSNQNSEYIIGFQGFNQFNTNLNYREVKLLPDATTSNYSGFGLIQYTFFDKLKMQMGLRYDQKSITTQAVGEITDTLSFRAPLEKSYGSMSGSLGVTFNLSDKILFRANFASAYRTPNLAELTSKGQHELRFEIGDNSLVPETSYEGDLSLHYHINNLTLDISGFYNKINNYIFIAPTGETTESNIFIYKYKQANSSLYGGEAGLHYHPAQIKWLHFETTFASVIGKQENGDYLPFIPAHKLRFELMAEKEKLAFFRNAYVSVNSNTAFEQNNAAPDETNTPAYTLLDLSIGGDIKVSGQLMSLKLSATNITDKKYIDHLSTLREVNLFNPGRNITFSLKIPFGLTK